MKTIFITAGTGYIGKRLTKQLLQRGHRVIAMVRMPAVKVKDSLRVTLKNWRESLSDDKADNLMAFADGDYVAVSGDWSATFKTDFMGMKTAGKKVKIKDVDIFKFNSDGMITEHHNVQSSAEMMKQLGIGAPK